MEGGGGAPAPPASVGEAYRDKLMRNLEKANIARKAKKALRAAIKAGEVNDLEVLRGDSPYEHLIEGWPIERLLLLMRRIGKGRVVDILDFARIRPQTKLHKLSYAEREKLCTLVEDARKPSRGGILK